MTKTITKNCTESTQTDPAAAQDQDPALTENDINHLTRAGLIGTHGFVSVLELSTYTLVSAVADADADASEKANWWQKEIYRAGNPDFDADVAAAVAEGRLLAMASHLKRLAGALVALAGAREITVGRAREAVKRGETPKTHEYHAAMVAAMAELKATPADVLAELAPSELLLAVLATIDTTTPTGE